MRVGVLAAVLMVLLLGRALDYELARAGLLSEREPKAVAGGLAFTPSVSPAGQSEPASLSESSRVIGAIRLVFPAATEAVALRVARCESRLNARAVSPTNDWGVFQLNRPTWDPARNSRARPYWPRGKDWRHVLDPIVNAQVAYRISGRGSNFWRHWRASARCWA